ncbi:hypothetical protein [Candidatus Stoquefichus sp. SB1]|uniref:hypothetical protein n=1 Tax=Candidatus Stoquefichus sp. SB1 TaxID=1658109 RepID=UPI00067F10F7|nr:hypothetical protein [Candidatus Stoquefichus sp. SB1]
MRKQFSNLELLEVIKKQWADTKDIQILSGCTRSNASIIMDKLREEIEEAGKKIPGYRVVSMKRLIKHLNIDENRIVKYAKIEFEMRKADLAESTLK